MGEIRGAEQVMFICGVLYSDAACFAQARVELIERYGMILFESEPIDFIFTEYYNAEMGEGIKRVYMAFERLIWQHELAAVKLFTNTLEETFVGINGRRVNLDPGYLNLSKLVLASTKDYSHRLYQGKGIFAEVTLNWAQKKFQPLPWTYPDYNSDYAKEFFTRVRNYYKTLHDDGKIDYSIE